MLINRILLGSVAFGVSFVFGLLANPGKMDKALITGAIAVPASFAGALVADRQRTKREKLYKNSLHAQIQELEGHQTHLQQSLSSVAATKQEAESSIDALQIERGQLLGRVSELNKQRDELNQDLSSLHKQKQQLEGEAQKLQTELQTLLAQQIELHELLPAAKAQAREAQEGLVTLQTELAPLQAQVRDQLQQKGTTYSRRRGFRRG